MATAILLRHGSSKPQLLDKPRAALLDEWHIDQKIRNLSTLEHIIAQLASRSDLFVRSEDLMNMNPIEFANSFRDHDLHFLLASTKTNYISINHKCPRRNSGVSICIKEGMGLTKR